MYSSMCAARALTRLEVYYTHYAWSNVFTFCYVNVCDAYVHIYTMYMYVYSCHAHTCTCTMYVCVDRYIHMHACAMREDRLKQSSISFHIIPLSKLIIARCHYSTTATL